MSKKSRDQQSNMEMGKCSNRRPPHHNIHPLSRLSAKVQPVNLEHKGCDEDTESGGWDAPVENKSLEKIEADYIAKMTL